MLPEGKVLLEKYWTALFGGIEGMYYDLYQSNLSTYLEHSPGYLEQGYQTYNIIFEGTGKNCQYTPASAGNYYFTLPPEGLYLSIPTLSGVNTGQVLHEGVDYEIHNYRDIKFITEVSTYSNTTPEASTVTSGINVNTNNFPHSTGESFLSKTSITLLPSLTNFIIPAFGQDKPEILLASGYYEPYISGWRSGTTTGMQYEKDRAYHLTKTFQSMLACMKKPPTLEVLEQIYSIINGFPFSYKTGTLTSVVTSGSFDLLTIATSGISEELVYEIPTGGDYLYESGDTVNKFDVLLSGIQFYDYIIDPVLISGIIRRDGTTQQQSVFVIKDFDGNKGFNFGSLSEDVIYTGGVLSSPSVVSSTTNLGGGNQGTSGGDTY